MQTVHQCFDQPKELKKECDSDNGINSVFDQLCEVTNYGDFSNERPPKELVHVKGRLKLHIDFWKKIGATSFILSMISKGYCLPFVQTPQHAHLPNNKSVLAHSTFAHTAIEELLMSKWVSEVSQLSFVVNPLSVSIQRSGKKRLNLDLQHMNQHLKKTKDKISRLESQFILLSERSFHDFS